MITHDRPRARLLVVLLSLLVLPLLTATPALAHAGLIGTDPADGSVVPTAPATVSLTFSEPVSPAGDATRLFDAAGQQVPVEVAVTDAVLALTPGAALADGTYVVAWRVISADGHPISGGFRFSVGAPSAQVVDAPDTEDRSDPALTALRIALEGLRYLGLLTLLGLVTFRLLVDRDGAVDPIVRRFRMAGTVAAVTAGTAAVLLVPVLRSWQDGGGLRGLADLAVAGDTWWSDSGLAAGLVVVAVLLLRQAERRVLARQGPGTDLEGHRPAAPATQTGSVAAAPPAATAAPVTTAAPVATPAPAPGAPPAAKAALAGAALAAVAALALVGHTRSYGPAWLVVGADVLHVVTAAAWLGGIVALGLLLVRPPADTDPSAVVTAVSRFSWLAAWLVAGLGTAGLVLFFWIAGEFSALWTTAYGVLVLVKTALVLVVLAVAATNRFRLVPAVLADPAAALPRLRRTVTAEAVLLVVVVLVTGALVSQSPRPDPGLPTAATRTLQLELGDVAATLIVAPGLRGPNTVQLMLIDGSGRPATPLEPPTITVSLPAEELGPFTGEVYELGAGYWQADVDLVVPGTWTIEVGARVSQFESPLATTEITVG